VFGIYGGQGRQKGQNMLIYFNLDLQRQVINPFYNSLSNFGFFCPEVRKTLQATEPKNST